MGWKEIKIDDIGKIEKCVGEFTVWMIQALPYAKVKIKVYENQDSVFRGIANIMIKKNEYDVSVNAVGVGKTIIEAFNETLLNFKEIIDDNFPKELFPEGLEETNIEYMDSCDF